MRPQRDRPQGPKSDSGNRIGDWPREGVLEIGKLNHDEGEGEEGRQKTEEGGGDRPELRTLLPNWKIKDRESCGHHQLPSKGCPLS